MTKIAKIFKYKDSICRHLENREVVTEPDASFACLQAKDASGSVTTSRLGNKAVYECFRNARYHEESMNHGGGVERQQGLLLAWM